MEDREERLPTVFAIPLVLIFLGFFLFISLLHGRKDVIFLTVLIFVMVGGAKVWGRMSISALKLQSGIDKGKVFPGETFHLRIHLENTKWLPLWLKVTLTGGSSLLLASKEDSVSLECGLLWRQKTDFDFELAAQRRGVYPVGPPSLIAGDLLGFFPREKSMESRDILVFPRIVPLKPLPLSRRELFGVPGARSPVQDPVYMLGTRDYQHSKPARFIHWKASARHDRLQEKIFEPSEQVKVLIVFDVEGFFENNAEDAFERSLEIAASLALRCDRMGNAFGLITNGKTRGGGPHLLPVAKNSRQLPALLEILARLTMAPRSGLGDVLSRDVALPWGLSAVILAREVNRAILSVGENMRRRKIPTLMIVSHFCPSDGVCGIRSASRIYHCNEIRLDGKGQG